jgi:hypothetical protein
MVTILGIVRLVTGLPPLSPAAGGGACAAGSS